MQRDIDEVDFTIFDTETTGLEPKSGDRIVEIAALRIRGQERMDIFQSLVNPQRSISPAAFAVNKITAQMLKHAPDIAVVMPKFLAFIEGSCLCSYNANFDLGFLHYELKLSGRELPKDIVVVDMLKMAKRLLPGMERYALWFVADKLGIKIKQEHRAFSDVELALSVFTKLKKTLSDKGITDFQNFTNLFGVQAQLLDNLNNQKLTQIQEAMDLGVKLKIRYISSSEARVSERQVIPKEIRQEQKYTYLIGHCCLRNEERTFRIDNILHLEII
ncbi:WYL domain-containing protein [bacterium]|nr:MAG: WYL domain-containing protein [bacterium]